MKRQITEKISIPEGVECQIDSGILTVKKSGNSLTRPVELRNIEIAVSGNEIILSSKKGSKIEFNIIKSYVSHIANLFKGLDNEYSYSLEACNVHFPMTLKLEKNNLIINNFLGEKVPRKAKILDNVKVDIKGPKITLTSRNKEAIGQTAANIEKSTKIKKRDRRIFQDGIFLVSKELIQ